MNRTQKAILLIIAIIIAFFIGAGLTYIALIGPVELTDLLGEPSGQSVEPSREDWAKAPRGDGLYRVGNQAEMALGRWYTDSNKYGCVWTRYLGKPPEYGMGSGNAVPLENGSSKTVMLTSDTDYFRSRGCGTWYMK